MRRPLRVIVLPLLLVLVACGGDDAPAAAPSGATEAASPEWCDLYRTTQARGVALNNGIPDQAVVDEVRGLMDQLETTAPTGVRADVQTVNVVLRRLLDAVVQSGFSPAVLADPTASVTEDERAAAETAGARLEGFFNDACSVAG